MRITKKTARYTLALPAAEALQLRAAVPSVEDRYRIYEEKSPGGIVLTIRADPDGEILRPIRPDRADGTWRLNQSRSEASRNQMPAFGNSLVPEGATHLLEHPCRVSIRVQAMQLVPLAAPVSAKRLPSRLLARLAKKRGTINRAVDVNTSDAELLAMEVDLITIARGEENLFWQFLQRLNTLKEEHPEAITLSVTPEGLIGATVTNRATFVPRKGTKPPVAD